MLYPEPCLDKVELSTKVFLSSPVANVPIIMESQSHHRHLKVSTTKHLLFYSVGIFICYFYYGIEQEKITKGQYGPEKETFIYTQSLVFVQCIVNFAFAAFMIRLTERFVDHTPHRYYASCAFSYLTAMLTSNHALQFVSYPTQVLGKSCKPIPVLIFGVIFAHRRYPLMKYLYILMITFGVGIFLFKEKDNKHSHGSFQFGLGEVLLLVSLGMDGTTGAIQERMRHQYQSRGYHMMQAMNAWSSIYLLIGLLATGELLSFSEFCNRHPSILWHLFSFSVASAFGQMFIFLMVAEFGPLPCSIVTTTRKFFTILLSVLYFRNPLTLRQWIGTVFVFAGIALDSAFGKSVKPQHHS